MPAKSKQQFKFFKSMEENPKEAKEKGISQSLVKEYTDGMTKERFKTLKKKLKKD
jgi:hypothetical protein